MMFSLLAGALVSACSSSNGDSSGSGNDGGTTSNQEGGGGSNATGSSSSGAAGDASGGTSNPGDGETGASAGAAASGPTGKIDLCSVFSAAALSSASGKSFGETLETESDGVYGCAYESSSDTFDWIVAVREPSDGDVLENDGLDLGGPDAVVPVNGTGYPTIASKAGVSLQVGEDLVEVYTPSSAADAQATTAQFVTVAKAVIAAISK